MKMDIGIDPENILILWKGYFRWQELKYPVTSTQITTTTSDSSTTMPTTPTTIYTTTLTKTATIISATPTDTNTEQIRKAVIDLFVPEHKPTGDPIPILITVTNPGDSQWTCDIPITFTNTRDENNVIVWMINVTLDVGETREILVVGITMSMVETVWKVRVGRKASDVLSA